MDCNDMGSIKTRLRFLLIPKRVLTIIALIFLFLIPQLAYNFYASGTLTLSLYDDESFIYFFAQKAPEVLFAPKNGVFNYMPVFILILAGIFILIKRKLFFGYSAAYIFIVYVLFYASWWSYYLGCGFGHRGLVDFYPVFIFPIIALFNELQKHKILFALCSLFLIACMVVTTKMGHAFDCCYYGKGDWDWGWYFTQLKNVFR